MHSWRVKFASRVGKSLKRFPKSDRKRLFLILGELSQDPYGGDIEKLEREIYVWRRRVGNYRIILEILPKERMVNILDVRRRTSKTY